MLPAICAACSRQRAFIKERKQENLTGDAKKPEKASAITTRHSLPAGQERAAETGARGRMLPTGWSRSPTVASRHAWHAGFQQCPPCPFAPQSEGEQAYRPAERERPTSLGTRRRAFLGTAGNAKEAGMSDVETPRNASHRRPRRQDAPALKSAIAAGSRTNRAATPQLHGVPLSRSLALLRTAWQRREKTGLVRTKAKTGRSAGCPALSLAESTPVRPNLDGRLALREAN